MNAFLPRAALVMALAGSVAAAEPQVRVAASRELRVAIVDFSKATEARDAVHQAFASSLGAAITRECGAPVGVRGTSVGVDHAAFNLKAGVYDAVLVVGRDLPTALRRTNSITLSAVPASAAKERTFYFLIPEGDESLQGLLASAFTRTINDKKFLHAMAVAEGRALSGREKVASAQE